MIRYLVPATWIRYDATRVADALIGAKAAVLSLRTIPYQRAWVERLQEMELKREVAGTSRIEGADFTERELDVAMAEEAPETALTRSQRQARAAVMTYRWIATLPEDRPLDERLILEIHRRIVTGADDDHCPPGVLRGPDENVNFGLPKHRGVDGGAACAQALGALAKAIQTTYRDHDPLIRALAAHYHFAAMHPFLDGNGRTARALEALLLQRAGLRDTCFIAMSNYYYDEKNRYLATLASVRAADHDLTEFLIFALRGLEQQALRLLHEIQRNVQKGLFRNLMFDLFQRLKTPKRRVIAARQLEILKVLLDRESLDLDQLVEAVENHYRRLRSWDKAIARDLLELKSLGALKVTTREDGWDVFSIRLEWPTEITETEFFAKLKRLPRTKTRLR